MSKYCLGSKDGKEVLVGFIAGAAQTAPITIIQPTTPQRTKLPFITTKETWLSVAAEIRRKFPSISSYHSNNVSLALKLEKDFVLVDYKPN